jgi:hypothetical protein
VSVRAEYCGVFDPLGRVPIERDESDSDRAGAPVVQQTPGAAYDLSRVAIRGNDEIVLRVATARIGCLSCGSFASITSGVAITSAASTVSQRRAELLRGQLVRLNDLIVPATRIAAEEFFSIALDDSAPLAVSAYRSTRRAEPRTRIPQCGGFHTAAASARARRNALRLGRYAILY